MKTNTKRLLSMIVALIMILSMLPVMALAATPDTLYLKPNSNWVKDGARFAAYFFGNGEKWVSLTDSDGDGYYEVTVPSGYPNVIFCRMNPSASANNWNNKWNQTGDLTIPTNGNNCFTVPSGSWDSATTSWGTYTPVVVPEWESPIVNGDSVTFNYWSSDNLTSVCVAGTINNWTIGAHEMTKGADGIWSVTVSGLYNGQYEYKFVTDGANWINDPKNTGAKVGDNNTFTITEGKVDVNEPAYISPVIDGGSVTFNYWRAEEFTSATVYGDMSNDGWATAYPMVKNEETGVWSVSVNDLYNGTYEYKIVVDDAWLVDPKNESIAASGNSVFTITDSEDEPELPPDVIAGPETVYFLPNFNWTGDYATFAAYFYNDAAEYTWTSMNDSNGDGVYEAAVPDGMTSVIFCRMNPDATEPSWETTWNQSSDLAIPTDGTDLFVMTQGAWDSSSADAPWAGAWETYAEPTVPEITSPVTGDDFATINYWHYNASSVSVWGSFNGWKSAVALTKQDDGSWSVTLPISYYGTFEYKLVVDNQWITDPNNTAEISPDGNSVFTVGTPVAEIYGVGVYYTFESAYAAVDSENGYVVILLDDVTVDGLAVDKELYLDLYGHNATFTNTTGEETIWVQDSATADVTTTQWGTLITDANYDCLGGYVMLPEAEGHSFHSFDVNITHVSLQPGSDALGFKATVNGDSAVLAAITGFGFDMGVEGGSTVTCEKDGAPTNGSFSLRLKNILACNGGEMVIVGSPFVIINGESVYGGECSTTMMETIQTVDNNWSDFSADQQSAVNTLMAQHADLITKWNLVNIAIAE